MTTRSQSKRQRIVPKLQCNICFENKTDASIHCTACRHTYMCYDCLKQWIVENGKIDSLGRFVFSCPTCRCNILVSASLINDANVKRILFSKFIDAIHNNDLNTTQNILSHYGWLATHQMNDISPMHEAAASGSIEIMQALSKHGANMFTQLSNGCMPIDLFYCYCIENHSDSHEEPNEESEEIFTAIQSGDDDAVRHMIRQDPDVVNYCSETTDTPVSHYVAQYGSEDLQLEVFSNPNTDVNVIHDGIPLHRYANIPLEVFQVLINRSDFNQINYCDEGHTYLHFALCFHDENESISKAVAMIKHPRIDLGTQDHHGYTALDVARYQELTEIVELIESRLQSSRIV